ncbi:sulfatase family protein [Winogradskyella psychrotolerans]|uniref:sulfatase family protein n=1 Tax=Winogradskyella psychrotolerans TaxID=1344585 RepID=UPI001C07DD85|nr:arylsulfatase [Winogradskyella psychrotolerans]MBU2929853.1 arylsulfatase [Winogradskyella psychrotolerans]
MKKKILVAFLLLPFLMTGQSKKDRANQNPNIIYILADDLGYGDVQAFNPEGKIPTPNIDEMASNGIKFTDAHTSSAVCTPTRYGILTGRYNWRTSLKNGVLSGTSTSLIKQDRTTIADMLKSQGYNTAYVGKWHLGWDWKITNENEEMNLDSYKAKAEIDFSAPIKNGPSTHGFDYSYGFCGSLDMPPYVYVENDMPTMVPTKTTISRDRKGFWREGLTSDDFVHATVLQDLTDKAVDYITENSKKETPFFLYFPLPAPHTPILPTTEFMGRSNTNMYGDFVMQVDDVVGQIREVLKKQGISENTLLVFTSDNGCSPRANFDELANVKHNPSYVFRGAKADIYEGGHRVPFVVEWPRKALKNLSSDKTICTTDFFATCAEIAGYKIKDTEAEDSYSMFPLFNNENGSDIREYTVHHSIDGAFAIRKGEWKLNLCEGSGGWSYPSLRSIRAEKLELPAMQLYNLKDDIGETKNLIDEHPEIAAELKAALKKIILDGRSTPGAIQQNEGMEGWTQIEAILN